MTAAVNVTFPGHVAKVEFTESKKLSVTVHGESRFKGTDVVFEVPKSALPDFQPGDEVTVTIQTKGR